MEVTIHEKNVKVDDFTKQLAHDKLEKISRFVKDAHRVEIEFAERKVKNPEEKYSCEVTVHCKRNVLKAHAEAIDSGEALDRVIDKIEHQAQKLKSRRVTRFHPRRRDVKTHALVPDLDLAELIFDNNEDREEAKLVKIKELDVKPMPVEEATLQMDLLGHDFFVFINAEDDKFSVVYKRKDGHLGIISPSNS